jgi:hypothetical protein
MVEGALLPPVCLTRSTMLAISIMILIAISRADVIARILLAGEKSAPTLVP